MVKNTTKKTWSEDDGRKVPSLLGKAESPRRLRWWVTFLVSRLREKSGAGDGMDFFPSFVQFLFSASAFDRRTDEIFSTHAKLMREKKYRIGVARTKEKKKQVPPKNVNRSTFLSLRNSSFPSLLLSRARARQFAHQSRVCGGGGKKKNVRRLMPPGFWETGRVSMSSCKLTATDFSSSPPLLRPCMHLS